MANLVGTIVGAPLVPTSTDDVFATHDAVYGLGGWREVATLTERNSITRDRMREGMAVYVSETDTVYVLTGMGDTQATDEWEVVPLGEITLSKEAVGLGNVDNTADADKPISTATQTALNTLTAKANLVEEIATQNTVSLITINSNHSALAERVSEVETALTGVEQLLATI